jgi:hypothetical protein
MKKSGTDKTDWTDFHLKVVCETQTMEGVGLTQRVQKKFHAKKEGLLCVKN